MLLALIKSVSPLRPNSSELNTVPFLGKLKNKSSSATTQRDVEICNTELPEWDRKLSSIGIFHKQGFLLSVQTVIVKFDALIPRADSASRFKLMESMIGVPYMREWCLVPLKRSNHPLSYTTMNTNLSNMGSEPGIVAQGLWYRLNASHLQSKPHEPILRSSCGYMQPHMTLMFRATSTYAMQYHDSLGNVLTKDIYHCASPSC